MIAVFLYRNPRVLLLILVVIVAAGTTAFWLLPRLEDPVLSRRIGVLTTPFPGAGTDRVESLVTVPLETSLTGIAEVKRIRSNSQRGISNILVELEDDVSHVEPIWDRVRRQVAAVQEALPAGCLSTRVDVLPLKAYASIIALRTPQPDRWGLAMLRQQARQLRERIVAISGTAEVDVFGDPGEEIVVEVEPAILASLGLSVGAMAEQIAAVRQEQPAGTLTPGNTALSLELDDQGFSTTQVAQTVITDARGSELPLTQIATVQRRLAEPVSALAIIGGRQSLVLGVMVSDHERIDRWSTRLEALLTEFASAQAGEAEAELIFMQRRHVSRRLEVLLVNLALAVLAVVVVVLVMMGWRSMLVVALSLPLSALMVLAVMRGWGIPIHQMSVTGLIVALGLLIDNPIVMVDVVRARIFAGAEISAAIAGGVKSLAMPLCGSTITTALAFLPIAMLPGPPGEFVGTIAVSVVVAISASLLLALSVVPASISWLGRVPAQRGAWGAGIKIPPLRRCYEWSLAVVFRAPLLGVLLAMVLPIAGFLAFQRLPEQFFPPSDRAQLQIEIERPAGDRITATERTTRQVREIVAAESAVLSQHWFIGGSAPTFYYNVVPRRRGTPFYAQGLIDLRPDTDSQALAVRLQQVLDRRIPEARVLVRQLEQGPPYDAPVEFRISGPDLAQLQRLGDQVRLLLSTIPGVIQTRADLAETIPGLRLDVDDVAVAQAGLDRSHIAAHLYTALQGAPAGTRYDAGEEIPVVVKLNLQPERMLEQIIALPIPGSGPPRVPVAGDRGRAAVPPQQLSATGRAEAGMSPPAQPTLAALVRRRLDADAGAIVRLDGQRTNEVKAYLSAGVLPAGVVDEFSQRLKRSNFALPPGYRIDLGGETEQRSAAIEALIANAIVLFSLMVLTLVVAFRSFRSALIIAAVGLLSAGLGPLALFLFQYPFGFMAILGTMGLIGVAINDSIVVLAAIRDRALAGELGLDRLVAVVSGCTRHIVTTTLTTIAGFLPLVLSQGEFWPPLAITVAGGVGGATLLALYFVPCCYLLLFRPRLAVPSG